MKNFTKEELQAICDKYIDTPVKTWGRDVADEIRDEIRKITGDNNYFCWISSKMYQQIKLSYRLRIDDYKSQEVIICYIYYKKQKAKEFRRSSEPQFDYKSFEIGNIINSDIEAAIAKIEAERKAKNEYDQFNEDNKKKVLKMICQELNIPVKQAQDICGLIKNMWIMQEEEAEYTTKTD